jgi:hypothetical protein
MTADDYLEGTSAARWSTSRSNLQFGACRVF